ncbi:DUF4238 domain-containing protein [Maricaulis sp.]|uniref:DUF4238 domain-containing protein n=1 Tax=Maricaulis sp. TaxID=1486257 RepID=UPI003A9065B0
MPSPRRHHFIPQFIIREFTDPDGYVWKYDKNKPQHGIERCTPKGVHWERHLYSNVAPDGKKDPRLELALARAESKWSSTLKPIIDAIRAGVSPEIGNATRATITEYFYNQYRRVPDRITTAATKFVTQGRLQALVDRRAATDPMFASLQEDGLSNEMVARIRKNAANIALMGDWEAVRLVLNKKSLFFARISSPNCSFVLGSNPIGRFGDPGDRHLAHPSIELSMPIASDIALGFTSDGGDAHFYPVEHREVVRSQNLSMFDRSSAVCSRSRELIESLAGPHIRQHKAAKQT